MYTKNRNKRYAKRVTMAQRHDDEIPVYGNLVVTPAQMLKMAEKGIPISSNNTSFRPEDGESNPSFDIPLDRLRGVDPAFMWEESQIIKQKARIAHNRDRQKYGDKPLEN